MMNSREQKVDAGRRMTSALLQHLDAGVSFDDALREIAPGLSPAAADVVRREVDRTAYGFACLGLILAGLVSPDFLKAAEVQEGYAHAPRLDPDEVAAEMLGLESPDFAFKAAMARWRLKRKAGS
jgi:hypothetical protein